MYFFSGASADLKYFHVEDIYLLKTGIFFI